MADQDLIIVDDKGRDHTFPPGMDPKRAAQIVRNTLLQEANARPLHEPTTEGEGFRKSLTNTATETAKGIGAGALAAVNPKNILKGVMSLPSLMNPWGPEVTSLVETARHPIEALKSLSDPKTGGNVIGGLLTALLLPKLPTRTMARGAATVLEDIPQARGWVPGATPIAKGLRKFGEGGPKPFHEQPLFRQMDEMGQDPISEGMSSTLPPSPDITPGGSFRQSGEFGKSGYAGQPGGYTSGRPAISDTRYDELQNKFGGGAPEGVGGLGPSLPLNPEGPVGATPPSLTADVPMSVAEERRMFGSQGAASPLGSAADVRAMSPGPSRLPLEAELRMQETRRVMSQATDNQSELEALLRKIIEERSYRR